MVDLSLTVLEKKLYVLLWYQNVGDLTKKNPFRESDTCHAGRQPLAISHQEEEDIPMCIYAIDESTYKKYISLSFASPNSASSAL